MSDSCVIYIADLTHTYISLSSGTFPLGAASVGSAIDKALQGRVRIEVFKYPDDLEAALNRRRPDVFMFSGYVWNQNLGLSFARAIKDLDPTILVVAGGPNISKEEGKREAFLKAHPYVDFFVLNEGEIAAAVLVSRYLDNGCYIEALKKSQPPQCLSVDADGAFRAGGPLGRIGLKGSPDNGEEEIGGLFKNLDDIPSPYLNGMMDKFFDDKLYPLVETNRGCPFSCTFCQQGEGYFSKMAMRDVDAVNGELELIAEKMVAGSPNIARIEFADPNFAMYKRDLNIAECLRKCQDAHGWPRVIGCSTGKNKAAQILDAVEKVLPDTLVISTAMQSTNPETLAEIKRDNISLDAYSEVQTEIHRRGLRSMADVILALPKETLDTHVSAVYGLIDSGLQEFSSYQAMILKSTVLETEASRRAYDFDLRWRLLPRGMGKYRIGGKDEIVADLEQIVVATNTLSFDDYLAARTLHLVTMIYHNSGIFDVIATLLEENGVRKSTLIKALYENALDGTSAIADMVAAFRQETVSELFDTESACRDYYCNEENLERVKNSEIGANLLFKYLSIALTGAWPAVTEELLDVVATLAPVEGGLRADLENYLQARVINVSQADMRQTRTFSIKTGRMLEILSLDAAEKPHVTLTAQDKTFAALVHYKTVYPNNPNGWSQMLAMLRPHSFIRNVADPT